MIVDTYTQKPVELVPVIEEKYEEIQVKEDYSAPSVDVTEVQEYSPPVEEEVEIKEDYSLTAVKEYDVPVYEQPSTTEAYRPYVPVYESPSTTEAYRTYVPYPSPKPVIVSTLNVYFLYVSECLDGFSRLQYSTPTGQSSKSYSRVNLPYVYHQSKPLSERKDIFFRKNTENHYLRPSSSSRDVLPSFYSYYNVPRYTSTTAYRSFSTQYIRPHMITTTVVEYDRPARPAYSVPSPYNYLRKDPPAREYPITPTPVVPSYEEEPASVVTPTPYDKNDYVEPVIYEPTTEASYPEPESSNDLPCDKDKTDYTATESYDYSETTALSYDPPEMDYTTSSYYVESATVAYAAPEPAAVPCDDPPVANRPVIGYTANYGFLGSALTPAYGQPIPAQYGQPCSGCSQPYNNNNNGNNPFLVLFPMWFHPSQPLTPIYAPSYPYSSSSSYGK